MNLKSVWKAWYDAVNVQEEVWEFYINPEDGLPSMRCIPIDEWKKRNDSTRID